MACSAAGQLAAPFRDEEGVERVRAAGSGKRAAVPAGGEIAALPQMGSKVYGLGGLETGHLQRLFHMEGPGLPVRAGAAIVEHPVGHVGVLLNLGNDQPRADGMEGAGGNKNYVSFFTGSLRKISVRVPALICWTNSSFVTSRWKP